jgi:predicted DNA-binding transcriptional regulator AlpA
MAKDEFPKPVPLQGNRVAWVSTEIIEWQNARIAARDKLSKLPRVAKAVA